MADTNWKALCLQLANEQGSEERASLVSQIKKCEDAEEHSRRMQFCKDAGKFARRATHDSDAAKDAQAEMQRGAQDAADMVGKAKIRQRNRARSRHSIGCKQETG